MLLGTAAVATAPTAFAQTPEDRVRRLEAWVVYTLSTSAPVAPMKHGLLLDFPVDVVRRRQVSQTVDDVRRYFAVVVPPEPDGVVLAAGNALNSTWNVHRTGTHGRRLGSAQGVDAAVVRWSGPECEQDFEAQVDYWVRQQVPG